MPRSCAAPWRTAGSWRSTRLRRWRRPGVHAVITAQRYRPSAADHPVPAAHPRDRALCAAGDRRRRRALCRRAGRGGARGLAERAEDALSAVALDIDPLPPVLDSAHREGGRGDAVRLRDSEIAPPCSPHRRAMRPRRFAAAFHIQREQFRVQRMTAMPMETRGLLAEWDEAAGRLTISGAAKLPFFNRRAMAAMMGLPEEAVDYIEYDVGGGFGARGEFYPEDFLVAFAARRFGRPVKWVEDRREHFMAIAHSRETECDHRDRVRPRRHDPRPARRHLGRHRRLCAAQRHDAGAQRRAVPLGPVSRPNMQLEAHAYVTNKTPSGTYRGPGRFEGCFFMERLLDMAASELGLDPARDPPPQSHGARARCRTRWRQVRAERRLRRDALRQRRLCQHVRALPCRSRLEREATAPGQADRRPLSRPRHRLLHRGRRLGPARERAHRSGSSDGIAVYVGSSAIGQGIETDHGADRRRRARSADGAYPRHARLDHLSARRLRLLRLARHRDGRQRGAGRGRDAARKYPRGGGQAARCAGGHAHRRRRPRDRARRPPRRAGRCSSVSRPTASSRTIPKRPTPTARRSPMSRSMPGPAASRCSTMSWWTMSAASSTRRPCTARWSAPRCRGSAACSPRRSSTTSNGQLLVGSLADYLVPLATDYPEVRAISLEEHPSPNNPLGAKGAGEGGIIPVGGALANAVSAALRRSTSSCACCR